MDRNAKWSTSTCIICTFVGFTMGFLACQQLLLKNQDLTTPAPVQYTP